METGIHEYSEEMAVKIEKLCPSEGKQCKNFIKEATYQAHIDERLVIVAFNEGGHNCTEVDLIDVLRHVKQSMPEVWSQI